MSEQTAIVPTTSMWAMITEARLDHIAPKRTLQPILGVFADSSGFYWPIYANSALLTKDSNVTIETVVGDLTHATLYLTTVAKQDHADAVMSLGVSAHTKCKVDIIRVSATAIATQHAVWDHADSCPFFGKSNL